MAGPSPPHTGPLKGIFLISTASTGQGWVLDNNLPVMISYSGYKTPTGEYTYDETIDNLPIIATQDKCGAIGEQTWSTKYAAWSKIGFNPDSGALEEALTYHGTVFWAATSGGAMKVVSANNGDNSSGSSGCSQVWVKYLGRDYLEYSTVVSMNGTTAVSLIDTSIARIQNFQAYNGNAPLGQINILTSSSDIISSIGVGLTRARNSMWTVPSGKTLFIKTVYYSAAGNGSVGRPTRFLLRTNYNPNQERYSTSLFWPISANLLKDEALYAAFPGPIRVPEKTDLVVSVITAAASSGNMCESIIRGYTMEN